MSFYSYKNANAECSPGVVNGNILTGLNQRVCIQVKNVYDSSLSQEQLDDEAVSYTHLPRTHGTTRHSTPASTSSTTPGPRKARSPKSKPPLIRRSTNTLPMAARSTACPPSPKRPSSPARTAARASTAPCLSLIHICSQLESSQHDSTPPFNVQITYAHRKGNFPRTGKQRSAP